MDAGEKELGELANKQATKQFVDLLVECGYDTVERLQTAVARELRLELGIPQRARSGGGTFS